MIERHRREWLERPCRAHLRHPSATAQNHSNYFKVDEVCGSQLSELFAQASFNIMVTIQEFELHLLWLKLDCSSLP